MRQRPRARAPPGTRRACARAPDRVHARARGASHGDVVDAGAPHAARASSAHPAPPACGGVIVEGRGAGGARETRAEARWFGIGVACRYIPSGVFEINQLKEERRRARESAPEARLESALETREAARSKPTRRSAERLVVEAARAAGALSLTLVQRSRLLLRDRLRGRLRLAALLVSRRRLLALEDVLLVLKVPTASGLRRRKTPPGVSIENNSHEWSRARPNSRTRTVETFIRAPSTRAADNPILHPHSVDSRACTRRATRRTSWM